MIFQEDWWMEAVAPGSWDKVEIAGPQSGSRVTLAFQRRRRYGLRLIDQPHLTPYAAPMLADPSGAKSRLGHHPETIAELASLLPPAELCRFRFPSSTVAPLPWQWSGFVGTVSTTFVFRAPEPAQTAVLASHQSSARRKVRRVLELATVDTQVDPEELLSIVDLTMASKGRDRGYPSDCLVRAATSASERSAGAVLGLRDERGILLAGAFVVWDSEQLTYLVGGRRPEAVANGGYGVLHLAMTEAAGRGLLFDFEGSQDPGVASFFRQMGGSPQVTPGVTRLSCGLGPIGRVARSTPVRLVFGS